MSSQSSIVPEVCGPWEGKVATLGSFSSFVVTSPTHGHIPTYPKEVEIIHTYQDGCWGVHEYSRHPQLYIEEMTHIACIPTTPGDEELMALFYDLHVGEDWEEERSIAVSGLGLIKNDLRDSLGESATYVIH